MGIIAVIAEILGNCQKIANSIIRFPGTITALGKLTDAVVHHDLHSPCVRNRVSLVRRIARVNTGNVDFHIFRKGLDIGDRTAIKHERRPQHPTNQLVITQKNACHIDEVAPIGIGENGECIHHGIAVGELHRGRVRGPWLGLNLHISSQNLNLVSHFSK